MSKEDIFNCSSEKDKQKSKRPKLRPVAPEDVPPEILEAMEEQLGITPEDIEGGQTYGSPHCPYPPTIFMPPDVELQAQNIHIYNTPPGALLIVPIGDDVVYPDNMSITQPPRIPQPIENKKDNKRDTK